MAINIPIITEFADQGLKSAQGAFSTFRQKVGEAEGGMGKFKAGSKVAFDSVKANAGSLATIAGGAIAGFAIKAIGDFQDLALSVDEFRNKTDLTLDQSSKWVSYTGDLGIEADAMTKIFSRLAKAATDEIPAFEELGVAIAFGEDGTTDIEETFLRVNDAINSLDDPVAEAAYRADLFGKGWMTASEIIVQGSDDIRTALDGVKDFEVIDEEEIEKAKDLRAAQDELGDAIAELSVVIGEALIPALVEATEMAMPFLEVMGGIAGATSDAKIAAEELPGALETAGTQVGIHYRAFKWAFGWTGMFNDETEKTSQEVLPELSEGLRETIDNVLEMAQANQDAIITIEDVDEALAELKGNVDERREWDNMIEAIEDAKEAAIDAFFEATPEALRESQRETDEARVKVAEYIAQMDNIPPDKKTEMIAALDQANLAEIEATFNYLARNRVSYIDVISRAREEAGTGSGMGSGRNTMSLSAFSSNSGGVTVNVAGSVISQNDLVETVRKGLVNAQRSGKGLVYSNS